MTFKSMKFHVRNPAESEAVQKKLFELGYRWFSNIGYSNLEVVRNLDKSYLFADNDGSITYSGSEEYFGIKSNKEINVQEFIKSKGEGNIMTTLEQQIKDTQEQLEKLTKALEEQKNKHKEWPQLGDEYYTVLYDGTVCSGSWHSSTANKNCKEMHNCFKTKAEAEHYRDWLKSPVTHSRYLLQKCADEYNGDWKYKPYLNNGYFLYINEGKMLVTFDSYCKQSKIYFKDNTGCQKAIEVLGEETIKLACGIV